MLVSSEVCVRLLFLLAPFICRLLFICQNCKGIKDRSKKRRIPLDSNFIFGVYKYSGVEMLSWTRWNSCAPLGKTFEENKKIIFCKLLVESLSPCSGVVCRPPTQPNMPFQRRRKCIFHWCGRTWLTIWDWVKIPRYSHKLMHRKRMTCELHDSYFCSMTIKHAIPKTVEVQIPIASCGGRLSGHWTII